MTPEQQRIAIAEWMGWQYSWTLLSGTKLYSRDQQELAEYHLPDYVNDLNAIHEAEKRIPEDQTMIYGLHINEIMLKDFESGNKKEHAICDWYATASQRAEALLRTIGKWID